MVLMLHPVVLAALGLLIGATTAAPPFRSLRRQAQAQAQAQAQNASALQVDLGYSVYEGLTNSTTRLNVFKGIRFAAPPTGNLRWQAPQPPALNRSEIISASALGPECPQSPDSTTRTQTFTLQNEDCLFLNVYAPEGASNLPVLVWIHGGGYGQGSGSQDLSAFINANNNSFVGVVIQYRLGAFGFVSSDEIARNGVVNAGLLDQHFALQWVQSYIDLFGGSPDQVTISGESAGGGSVMLQGMAYGGTLGTSLFVNSIAASPYLPQQYGYKDWIPSQSYYAFATAAGCSPQWAYGNTSQTIFQCLVGKDTETLQRASFGVSMSGTYGSWAFLPVTDGTFIQQLPSQQLLQRQVNGLNTLIGNNAEEGNSFTLPKITTENDLIDWVKVVFPLFTNGDIARLLYYYPSSNVSVADDGLTQFATSGYTGATALNVSQDATGQQQRAINIYAETTFVCPSYWLAEAYNDHGRNGYKYQYSVPEAYHGTDVSGYFGPAAANQGPDFVKAFQTIWGNFIKTGIPLISVDIANGATSNGTSGEAASNWTPFTLYSPYQLNLNQTGGTPFQVHFSSGLNVTEYREPGLRNDFSLVNAYTWEGGRGTRCDFWRSVAALVPE